jgi:hypothetical protein
MLANGFSYSPLKRARLRERGLRCLMAFISGRMLRGAPRLLAYLVGFLTISFLVLRFISQELSQAAAETSKAVWHWQTGESWDASRIRIDQENFLGYGEDGLGSFRIVVFGEQDVATPSRKRTGEKVPAWTDVMCQEVYRDSLTSLDTRLTCLSFTARLTCPISPAVTTSSDRCYLSGSTPKRLRR